MFSSANSSHPESITHDDFAGVLSESEVHSTLDLGSVIAYKVSHPQRGNIVLINTAGVMSGCLPI